MPGDLALVLWGSRMRGGGGGAGFGDQPLQVWVLPVWESWRAVGGFQGTPSPAPSLRVQGWQHSQGKAMQMRPAVPLWDLRRVGEWSWVAHTRWDLNRVLKHMERGKESHLGTGVLFFFL